MIPKLCEYYNSASLFHEEKETLVGTIRRMKFFRKDGPLSFTGRSSFNLRGAMNPWILVLLFAITSFSLTAQKVSSTRNPVRPIYTVRYISENGTQRFAVTLEASGLRPSSKVTGVLADWGEWSKIASPYITNLRIDGSAQTLDKEHAIVVPAAFLKDRKIKIDYEIILRPSDSPEQLKHPLLPNTSNNSANAFTRNVLMGLKVDGKPLGGDTVAITVIGESIFTGWGGMSTKTQTGIAPNPILDYGNGIFVIGRPMARAVDAINNTQIEVAQFAEGPDITAAVAEIAKTMLPVFAAATGIPAPPTLRIAIKASSREDVLQGTYTDGGILLDLEMKHLKTFPETRRFEDYITESIVHELFHAWLGGSLKGGDGVVWFYEGFTTYISLYYAAAAGYITPSRFAERITDMERWVRDEFRRKGLNGRPAFADANVNWRKGANDQLSYQGGALLAFLVDVRLRQTGNKKVSDVLRSLYKNKSRQYTLSDIRNALKSVGLADVYEQYLAGKRLPETHSLLVSIGYAEGIEKAALTYFGIDARSDSADALPAVVTEVDPRGPAAKAGILAGDTINGWYADRRSNPPIIGREVTTKYRFALNLIPSGSRTVVFDVVRDGKAIKVEISPQLIPGGERKSLRWNPERGKNFFELSKPLAAAALSSIRVRSSARHH